MPTNHGTSILCAAKLATTYGTAVALGSGNGFRAKSFTYSDEWEQGKDMGMTNNAQYNETTVVGNFLGRFEFTLDLKYDGLDLLLANYFGTAGTPGGANPYSYSYSPKTAHSTFITLGMYDGIKTHEWDSAFFESLKVKQTAGHVLEGTLKGFGRKRTENSATNASLSSVTEPSTIQFVQSYASVIDYKGAAKASSLAAMEIIDWEFEYKRDWTILYSDAAPYMRQPTAGALTCLGKITIPYEATTLSQTAGSGAIYKLYLKHVATASTLEMNFGFPSVRYPNFDQNVKDRGATTLTLDVDASAKAYSAPSGLALVAPYISGYNGNSADPLA